MDFLVEFVVVVPSGTPESEVDRRSSEEAVAASKLADAGHLVRLWTAPAEPGETRALGIYRAADQRQLEALLEALPLDDWMQITVTPLGPHPNDPPAAGPLKGVQTTRV